MKAKIFTVVGALFGAICGFVVFRALDAALVSPEDWIGLFLSGVAGSVAGAVVVEHAMSPARRNRRRTHRGGVRALFLLKRHIQG
jgi:hypothetical protein